MRLGRDARLARHEIDELARLEVHLPAHRGQVQLQDVLDLFEARYLVPVARAEKAVQEADVNEAAQGQRQQAPHPGAQGRIGRDVRVHAPDVGHDEQEHEAEPFVAALPDVVGPLDPQGRGDEEGHEREGGHAQVVAQDIWVAANLLKPQAAQEARRIRQFVRREEERMPDDEPEGPAAQALVYLIDLVQAAQEALHEPPARGQDNAPAHEHRGRERGGLGRVLVRVREPVLIMPLAAEPQGQREQDAQDRGQGAPAAGGDGQHACMDTALSCAIQARCPDSEFSAGTAGNNPRMTGGTQRS